MPKRRSKSSGSPSEGSEHIIQLSEEDNMSVKVEMSPPSLPGATSEIVGYDLQSFNSGDQEAFNTLQPECILGGTSENQNSSFLTSIVQAENDLCLNESSRRALLPINFARRYHLSEEMLQRSMMSEESCSSSHSHTEREDEQEIQILSSSSSRRKSDDYKPLNKRSRIYDYFEWVYELELYRCKAKGCNKTYRIPKGGGTGSLHNHVNTKHHDSAIQLIFEKADANKNYSVPKMWKPPCSDEKIEHPNQELLKDKLFKHIVCSMQPFSLVSEFEFQDLLRYCLGEASKDITIPSSRDSVRAWVMEMFDIERKALKSRLRDNNSKVSFVIDCWTSSNQIPYQGVICSWIDPNWQLCNEVIDFQLLHGKHNGKNICSAFCEVLSEFELWNKVLTVTTDNVCNMDTFFLEFEKIALVNGCNFRAKDFRVRCLGHIMNLSCHGMISTASGSIGYPDLEDSDYSDEDETCALAFGDLHANMIVKLRKGVAGIRNSPQRREMFKMQCKLAKLKYKQLILDVKSQWNSTYCMLKRCLEFCKPYEATLASIPKLKQYMLKEDEWKNVELMVQLLVTFREASEMLCSDHSPTLSCTSSVYQVLLDHLEHFVERWNLCSTGENTNGDLEWLTATIKSGQDKLLEYYPMADGLCYIVNTVMDPRYKLIWYKAVGWPEDWIDTARKAVTNLWESKYKPKSQDSSGAGAETTKPTSSRFQDIYLNQMKSVLKTSLDDELSRYLKEGAVNGDLLKVEKSGIDGALGWWKIHEKEYPNLAKMAKDYLAIPATGVSIERLFSAGTNLLMPYTQRPTHETVRACTCLKFWLLNKRNPKEVQDKINGSLRFKIMGDEDYNLE